MCVNRLDKEPHTALYSCMVKLFTSEQIRLLADALVFRKVTSGASLICAILFDAALLVESIFGTWNSFVVVVFKTFLLGFEDQQGILSHSRVLSPFGSISNWVVMYLSPLSLKHS